MNVNEHCEIEGSTNGLNVGSRNAMHEGKNDGQNEKTEHKGDMGKSVRKKSENGASDLDETDLDDD